jgi:hypothetical protein
MNLNSNSQSRIVHIIVSTSVSAPESAVDQLYQSACSDLLVNDRWFSILYRLAKSHNAQFLRHTFVKMVTNENELRDAGISMIVKNLGVDESTLRSPKTVQDVRHFSVSGDAQNGKVYWSVHFYFDIPNSDLR